MQEEIRVIDYETTGLNPYKGDRIFAFIVTNPEDFKSEVYRFDWGSNRKNNMSKLMFNKYHSKKYIKVAHNSKFEMGFTAMYYDGVLPESTWEDTFIMSKMLKNILPQHKLEFLAKLYFRDLYPEEFERWEMYDAEVKKHLTMQKRLMNNYPDRVEPEILEPLYSSGVKPFVIDTPNYGLVPVDIMNGYQEADGERCSLLYLLYIEKIKANKDLYLDYLNEMRLITTTQKMEQRGMMVHVRNAKNLIKKLSVQLDELHKEKVEVFGFDINLNSTDQIQKHLFGYINPKKHEKLDDIWKTKSPAFKLHHLTETAGGAPSASKDDILNLIAQYPENEGLDIILKYRSWSKGVTMIQSYLDKADNNDIIHPNTRTNQAATGRQSVTDPNLQNVSKMDGRRSVYGIPARVCFKPKSGYVMFLGDYAGIEMRLIIGASGEMELIEKLNADWDYDVHTDNGIIILADEFLNAKKNDKSLFKKMRANIKDCTFGKCYGANFPTFCGSIEKTHEEGKPCWERFKEARPQLFNFTQNMMTEIKRYGYITTAFGRQLRAEKDYFAANYRIQGDAAGILKRAQNNVDEYILNVWDGDYDRMHMSLTVHDEIIFELHRSMLNMKYDILHDITYCMTNMPEIKVPLCAEWKLTTTNWQDAKGMEI